MITFNDAWGAGGGGSARLWVSGATVKQFDTVVSPLDGDIYRRKTATGAGAVDPANDLTNYIAVTYRRCRALTPPSATPIAGSAASTGMTANGIKVVTPAPAAATRTQIVSVTGRGRARFAGVQWTTNTAQAMTARFEIIIDGRTVLDFTGVNGGITQPNWTLIGGILTTTSPMLPVLDSIFFRRSFEVYVTPTTAMTTAWNFMYAYDEEA